MVIGIYTWKIKKNVFTTGGDGCYYCPNCGGGEHVYGIENQENYSHECPECKTKLIYPWESKEKI